MNGTKLLVATNISIYFLKGDNNIVSLFNDFNPVSSFICELELLSYTKIIKDEEIIINNLMSDITIIDYNNRIKNLTIQIRKNFKIKLPDAIVAATAKYLELPLISADRLFDKIDNLEIIIYET